MPVLLAPRARERREPLPVLRRARVSRTARILSVAAIGVACGGTTTPTDGGTDGSNDDVSVQPAYGAVIPDSGFDAPSNPPDAAADASDASDDADSSGIALYGAPPPLDGGSD